MNRDDERLTEKLHSIAQQIEPAGVFRLSLESELRTRHEQLHGKDSHRMTIYLRRLTTIAAAFVLLLAVILLVPPIRSLAQDIIDSLFTRADSNEKMHTYQPITDADSSIVTAEEYYATLLTIEEAEALSNFDLKVPATTPPSYTFRGVSYSEKYHSAMLIYTLTGRGLYITQQPVEFAGEGDWPLGADANIIQVQIGSLEGEYVQGGWYVKPADIEIDKSTGLKTEKATWISEASERRLRWIDDEMQYEIRAMGGSEGHRYVGQQEMIEIALSMQ
jgi:hypothetical protein